MQAVNRQVAHYAHHVGQIVMLAKHLAHERWQSLSVPRNQSPEFNRRVAAGEVSQRWKKEDAPAQSRELPVEWQPRG